MINIVTRWLLEFCRFYTMCRFGTCPTINPYAWNNHYFFFVPSLKCTKWLWWKFHFIPLKRKRIKKKIGMKQKQSIPIINRQPNCIFISFECIQMLFYWMCGKLAYVVRVVVISCRNNCLSSTGKHHVFRDSHPIASKQCAPTMKRNIKLCLNNNEIWFGSFTL